MSIGVIHSKLMRKIAITITLFTGLLTAGAAHAQIGLDFLNLSANAEIGDVLSRLYVYGVGVVAIAAMIMLVIGGVQYMVAGDKDPSSAKKRIRNAIWGLILALTSYLILYTINPDLTKKVKLKILDINVVPAPKIEENTPCTINDEGISKECNVGSGFICSVQPGQITGKCVKVNPNPPTHAELQTRCRAHTQSGPCNADTTNSCAWQEGVMTSACNTTAP